jgi:hypothetical protein
VRDLRTEQYYGKFGAAHIHSCTGEDSRQ